MTLVAKLEISHKSRQEYILVTLPDGTTVNLWKSIVEHCAKSFSNNELKKIHADCQTQVVSMHPDNVPLVYHELLSELVKSMKERRIKIQNIEPPKGVVPYWNIK